VTVCVVDCTTGTVAIAKLAVVAPAANATEAGSVIPTGLLFASGTTKPPGRAGPLSFTCPVALWPPVMVAGEMTRENGAGGKTVSWAVLLTPPAVAVIVTVVDCATGTVVNVNVTIGSPL
jgi:hypothetical protein